MSELQQTFDFPAVCDVRFIAGKWMKIDYWWILGALGWVGDVGLGTIYQKYQMKCNWPSWIWVTCQNALTVFQRPNCDSKWPHGNYWNYLHWWTVEYPNQQESIPRGCVPSACQPPIGVGMGGGISGPMPGEGVVGKGGADIPGPMSREGEEVGYPRFHVCGEWQG